MEKMGQKNLFKKKFRNTMTKFVDEFENYTKPTLV